MKMTNKTMLQQLMEMTHDAFAKVRMVFRSNFAKRGVDLSIPAHAYERSVDGERGNDVTEQYMMSAMQAILVAYDRSRAFDRLRTSAKENRGQAIQLTIKHAVDDTYINLPCMFSWKGGERYSLIVRTVMVKRDFHSYVNDIVIEV